MLAQAVELRRLTLLHQDATPVQASPCPTTAAIMALLTPELATNLLVALALLQTQTGLGSGTAIEGLILLQQVLGLAAGRRPDLIPVEDDAMSAEL